ncbi:prepilin peptidase [Glaciibacter superstes]|uniref:prepilin peptidase n=1 Tax=Glaciibacter superstes TaxID=501023 RepID=UPI0003B55000|nr:prepilin peptidase [Glaciibacter superstes]
MTDTATSARYADSAPGGRGGIRWARLAWQAALAVGLAALAVASVGVQPALLPAICLAVVTGELCRRDVVDHRLPNNLVVPALAISLSAVAAQWLADGGSVPVVALVAGAGYFLFLLALNLGGGMGMGDVKLGAALGVALGLLGVWSAAAGLVLAFVVGGVGGLVFLLVRRANARSRIPFGPFLLVGYWVAIALTPLLAAAGATTG